MPLDIIYEDVDIIVVDKPAGLTVHPAPGHPSSTLVNALLSHYPRLAEISNSARPGIVHRLDKDTSGLMIVAKNAAAQLNLVNQFKTREVVKVYCALVKGRLVPREGVIEAPIGRDPVDRKKMAVVTYGRPPALVTKLYDIWMAILSLRPNWILAVRTKFVFTLLPSAFPW